MVDIALKCGYFEDKSIIITAEEANHLKPGEVCLLCTGSQGEPLAALSRIAAGTHRQISLMPNDIVVFSSSPIPGNTASVSKTINKLYKKGVRVFTNAMSEIHSSGHANQDELKLMIRLFKPKYFVPYHGEFRMLKKHTDLGVMCSVPRRNTFVLENGDVLALEKGNLHRDGKVQAGEVYVDGSRIGGVGSAVIKDRILMSTNGILVIIANIDMQKKILMGSPAITTRGYILVNENTDLIREIQKYVDGKVLYIPRRSEKAMGWGEKNGAKNRLAKRNKEIVSRFNSGETIAELGKMFFLSEKRIQGIIREYESSKNQDGGSNNE